MALGGLPGTCRARSKNLKTRTFLQSPTERPSCCQGGLSGRGPPLVVQWFVSLARLAHDCVAQVYSRPRGNAFQGIASAHIYSAIHWQFGILFFSGFRPIFGQAWPQNPSRTTGLVLQCRLHQTSAPQTNSKTISWQFGIRKSPLPMNR
jgi:hypothetical protein